MALKHDAQGFLVGDPVEMTDQVDLWRDIQSDVAAIRRLLSRMARPAGDVGASVKPPSELIKPGHKDQAIEVGVRVDVQPGRGGDGGAGGIGGSGGAGGIGGPIDARKRGLRDGRGRFASPSWRRIPASEPRDESRQEAFGRPATTTAKGVSPAVTPGTHSFAVTTQSAVASTHSTATFAALPPKNPGSPVSAQAAEPDRRSSATLPIRGAGGRLVGRHADAISSNDSGATTKDRPPSDAEKPAHPSGCDSRGRFSAGDPVGREDATSPSRGSGRDQGDARDGSLLRSLTERVVEAAREVGSGAGEADPTIRAFSEVAQPMMCGYQALTGGDRSKRQEGWLRRISASLTGFRREDSQFAKTAAKSLKGIEEKPTDEGGSGGGGILSMLLGFFAKLPLLGTVLTGVVAILSKAVGFFSKMPGGLIGKAAGAIGSAGLGASKAGRKAPNEVTPATAAGQATGSAPNASPGKSAGSPGAAAKGGFLKKAGGAAAKFGKRIPVLGALIALGMGASAASATESDDSLTREQKNVEHSKTAGGIAGGLAGAAAGAAIGSVVPVVGTVIGGILGAALGEWMGQEGGRVVGENLGRISEAANSVWQSIKDGASGVWETANSAWESIKTGSSSVWETMRSGWMLSMEKLSGFVDSAKAGWDRVASLFQSAYEGLKSIPVIGGAIKAAEDLTKKAATQAAPIVDAAKQKVAETGQQVAQKVEVVTAQAAPVAAAAKDKAAEAGSKVISGARQVIGGASAAMERAYNVTAATAGSALETVMPKGYRHKALFDGIKGGDSLTKYGSYTDEEAARIRELKTSGANTSANVKGGMSPEVQDKISAQAKKAGLDPVMMQKIAAMESGGNANAISSTGAAGIYQFVGRTASGVGIKNRFDVDQNIEGGMKLTRQNQAALEKAGLPITAENLYMMHQLGPGAAKEVIRGAEAGKSKAEMSPETQKAMNLNYGANSKTAADYIATNKKALDDRYAAVTKGGDGSQAIAAAKAQQASVVTAVPAATAVASVAKGLKTEGQRSSSAIAVGQPPATPSDPLSLASQAKLPATPTSSVVASVQVPRVC